MKGRGQKVLYEIGKKGIEGDASKSEDTQKGEAITKYQAYVKSEGFIL